MMPRKKRGSAWCWFFVKEEPLLVCRSAEAKENPLNEYIATSTPHGGERAMQKKEGVRSAPQTLIEEMSDNDDSACKDFRQTNLQRSDAATGNWSSAHPGRQWLINSRHGRPKRRVSHPQFDP